MSAVSASWTGTALALGLARCPYLRTTVGCSHAVVNLAVRHRSKGAGKGVGSTAGCASPRTGACAGSGRGRENSLHTRVFAISIPQGPCPSPAPYQVVVGVPGAACARMVGEVAAEEEGETVLGAGVEDEEKSGGGALGVLRVRGSAREVGSGSESARGRDADRGA